MLCVKVVLVLNKLLTLSIYLGGVFFRGTEEGEERVMVGFFFFFPLIYVDRTDRREKECRFKEHLLAHVPDADSYI